MNSNDVMEQFDIALSTSEVKRFDFGTYEISAVEIAKVEEQEQKIINNFRKYKNNLFEICSSLADIEKILKPSGSFMAWYENAGFTKDMISVFLKRWQLFTEFPDFRDRIFTLSDQAIKFLTRNELEYDDVLAILGSNITKAQEIKNLLLPVVEKTKEEFLPSNQKFFNFNKIKKMKQRAKKLKVEERIEYKKELEEYIKNMQHLLEEL